MPNKLAITCGDPSGVGPEVAAAWLAAHPDQAGDVAVIGPASWLATLPGGCEKIEVGLETYVLTPGHPNGEGALIAWASMERAAQGCAHGEFTGVVTGPVAKGELAKLGYAFPGQTEFFASQWGGEPTMAFAGGKLRVALATWHISLRSVPDIIDPPAVERAVYGAHELARADGILHPRIGVCGLNPHAGEGGLLGEEEDQWINPTLARIRQHLPGLSTCQPGDSLFYRAVQGEFDAVVALYHDQGLGPLKLIDFESSVNVTLGLKHVRTSPDHGTAFSLAGKGKASAKSFTNAVSLAQRLIRLRA